MFPFNKIFAYGRNSDRDEIAYKSVDLQVDDDTQPTPDKSSMIELAKVKKKLRLYRTGFFVTHAFQGLFFLYWLFGDGDAPHPHATYRDLEWSGLLGEDWNGIVPNGTSGPTKTQSGPHPYLPLLRYIAALGVGYPLKPTYWGHDHPYYMPEDIFDDFDKSMAIINHQKYMHNSSSIFVRPDEPRAKRLKPDGSTAELPTFWPWEPLEDGRELYAIRGFHQMHCIFVISEEFTYHYAQTNDSLWTAGHVAHCINTLRDAVMCMADAQPLSYVNGYKNGHATDDQAMMCRDWEELHKFVTDPARGLRIKNVAPAGSKNDKMAPIIPYPELTEAELRGIA